MHLSCNINLNIIYLMQKRLFDSSLHSDSSNHLLSQKQSRLTIDIFALWCCKIIYLASFKNKICDETTDFEVSQQFPLGVPSYFGSCNTDIFCIWNFLKAMYWLLRSDPISGATSITYYEWRKKLTAERKQ